MKSTLTHACLGLAVALTACQYQAENSPTAPAGTEKAYRGVEVHNGGAEGGHFASDGYYYGQKWQCVEYVKRFYHQVYGHRMPHVWGHAKDFYRPDVNDGDINPERGLRQFRNGSKERPQPGDLLVFSGHYGHVAIVCSVSDNQVEIIQQNAHPVRDRLHLQEKEGEV